MLTGNLPCRHLSGLNVRPFLWEEEGVNDVEPSEDTAENCQQDGFVPAPGYDDGDNGAEADTRTVVNGLVVVGCAVDGCAGGKEEDREKKNEFVHGGFLYCFRLVLPKTYQPVERGYSGCFRPAS